MKILSEEEINSFWHSGDTFKQLIQAAYERGYQDHMIDQEKGIRRLIKDIANIDSLEDRDQSWYEYQKNRNR